MYTVSNLDMARGFSQTNRQQSDSQDVHRANAIVSFAQDRGTICARQNAFQLNKLCNKGGKHDFASNNKKCTNGDHNLPPAIVGSRTAGQSRAKCSVMATFEKTFYIKKIGQPLFSWPSFLVAPMSKIVGNAHKALNTARTFQ
jgi:hypothetical protein